MQMQQIARGWLVYDLTESPLALGIIMLSFSGPMAIFSLFGGALADRVPKIKLVIIIHCLNIILVFMMATLISFGIIRFWHLVVFGLINGSLIVLQVPSRQSIVPEIVNESRLINAIALNASGQNLARIIGPAIAGIIIAIFGTGVVFYTIGFIYIFSVLFIYQVRVKERILRNPNGILKDISQGFKYVIGNSTLRNLIILASMCILIGMMTFQSLIPAWSVEALNVGAEGLGLLMAMMGIGAVFGALFIASLGGNHRKGLILIGSTIAWAVFLFIFSKSTNITLAFGLLIIIGFFSATFLALNQSLVQLYSDREMRGRVMSITVMSWGLMPFGVLPIAALAEQIGTPNALAASSIILCVFGIIFAIFNRKFTTSL